LYIAKSLFKIAEALAERLTELGQFFGTKDQQGDTENYGNVYWAIKKHLDSSLMT